MRFEGTRRNLPYVGSRVSSPVRASSEADGLRCDGGNGHRKNRNRPEYRFPGPRTGDRVERSVIVNLTTANDLTGVDGGMMSPSLPRGFHRRKSFVAHRHVPPRPPSLNEPANPRRSAPTGGVKFIIL